MAVMLTSQGPGDTECDTHVMGKFVFMAFPCSLLLPGAHKEGHFIVYFIIKMGPWDGILAEEIQQK